MHPLRGTGRHTRRIGRMVLGFITGAVLWGLVSGVSELAYAYLYRVDQSCFLEGAGCVPLIVYAPLTATRYGPVILVPASWGMLDTVPWLVPVLSGVLFGSIGALSFALAGKKAGCAALVAMFPVMLIPTAMLMILLHLAA